MMKNPVKYRRKWGIMTILGVAWCLCMLLGGCRLAKEDQGVFGADQLIGMLVTTQKPSEDILQRSGEQEELEGVKQEQGWYEFPQVSGAAMIRQYDEENDAVSIQGPDGWFSDIHFDVKATDEGESHEYSGVFCISSDFDGTLYFCPVYEREDQSVYAIMTGDRYEFSRKHFQMGVTVSKSVKEESSVTKDGEKKADAVSFTIHVKREEPLEELRLLEMNRDHEVIGSTTVDEKQKILKLQPEASYVIAEMVSRNMEGKTEVHHAVYDVGKEDESGITRPYETEDHFIYWKMLEL